ncbi:MAG: hypothetical protein ACOX9C_08380 [Kiritimatiellia bacterium]|jgi:hypothetical protein
MDRNKPADAGRKSLRISSVVLLLIAAPMARWTLNMVHVVAPHDLPGDDRAALGCMVGTGVYGWSLVVAVCGLVLGRRPERYGLCRLLGWISVAALGVCAILLRMTFLMTMLPLAVLIALFLWGAYGSERRPKGRAK